MKRQRVLCLLLALSLALGLAVTAQAAERRAADFPDFDSRAWYAEAMTAAVRTACSGARTRASYTPKAT